MNEVGLPSIGDWGPWLGIDPVTRKRTHFARPVWYRAGDMERAVVFQPGYRTDRKSFGLHGMEITWLLRGPRGVTQFVLNTGWVPGEKGTSVRLADYYPSGVDLGYHALCPQYEGAEDYGRDDCAYLAEGQKCFYDGSGLNADALVPRFRIEGEAAIWRELAEEHDRLLVPGDSIG